MARFDGKTILITGGSGGIGRATAERLASEGASLILTGTSEDKLADVAKATGAKTLVNDAGDPQAAHALADAVEGQLDGLYLNAGYGAFSPHDQVDAETFDRQYAVNVRGPALQMAALSPKLKDGGAVLVTGSIVSEMGMQAASLYGGSKGAMRTWVKVLAAELAPRGIRVNAVAPGPIGSDFFARTGIPEEDVKAMGEQIKGMVPLGRFGEPSEIAAVAAFLLSDEASYVTAATWDVDGGMAGA